MSAATTPPLHVLRGILRHLKKAPSTSVQLKATNPNEPTIQQQIISQYRAAITLPLEQSNALHAMAYDYLTLQTDLAERARLHELDAGAEEKLTPKELSRRAAARAGLQLPKLD